MGVGSELKRLALRAAYGYLDQDPETNLPKLMEWVDSRAGEQILSVQRNAMRKIIAEKDSNWYQLITSLWTDIDDEVRKTLFETLIMNSNLLAAWTAEDARKRYDCHIPWAIALDMGRSPQGQMMTFDDLDSVIEQAKELGTFVYYIYGDMDLERREETIALCNKHKDCQFIRFSHADGIDEDFADQMLRVKNLVAAIQVWGTVGQERPNPQEQQGQIAEQGRPEQPRQTETLDQPGQLSQTTELGQIAETMKLLHEKKLPFGTFCRYDGNTAGNFAKETFFDEQIQAGSKFCFFFSSVKEEDDELYPLIKNYKHTKPLLTINFCKDKDITGGCMACKYCCAVDADGDLLPCVFKGEPCGNLQEEPLVAAYQSELFRRYSENPPQCSA